MHRQSVLGKGQKTGSIRGGDEVSPKEIHEQIQRIIRNDKSRREKKHIKNLGEIVGWFVDFERSVNEMHDDVTAWFAPSECHGDVSRWACKEFDRLVIQAEGSTNMNFREIVLQVRDRVKISWLYRNGLLGIFCE